jgi:flagellar hook-basal body complex protein FliE
MSVGAIGGFAAQFVNPTAAVDKTAATDAAKGTAEAKFSGKLESAIDSVDAQQHMADDALQELGNGGQNASLHGSMVALTEAEIALRTMVSVRDKVVSAYEQIMNMSI